MCRILPVLGFVWGRRAGRYTSWSSVNIHPGELKLPQKSIFVRATIWGFFWFFFLIFERDVDLLSNSSHQVILISAPVNHRYSPGLLLLNVTSLLLICHLSHHGLFPNHHRLTPKPTNTHSPLQEGFFLFFFFFLRLIYAKRTVWIFTTKPSLNAPPPSLPWVFCEQSESLVEINGPVYVNLWVTGDTRVAKRCQWEKYLSFYSTITLRHGEITTVIETGSSSDSIFKKPLEIFFSDIIPNLFLLSFDNKYPLRTANMNLLRILDEGF